MKLNAMVAMLVFSSSAAMGQSQLLKQMSKIYDENKYKEVITIGNKLNTYLQHDDEKALDDVMGRSYYALGMYDSALYFENKALSIDNDATWVSGWAYTYRGMANYRLGNKEESVRDLQKAIDLDKTHNSTEVAKEFLSEVVTGSVPGDSCAFYFSQGQYKSAIEEGRIQLQKKDYKSVLQLVGAAYANIHYYDSAIYFERRALEIDNDATLVSGWAHFYLGMALFHNHEKDKAVEELRKAIELNKTANSVHKAENLLDDIINNKTLVIDSLHQVIKDQLNSNNYRGATHTALAYLATNPSDPAGWDQLTTAYCWLHNYDSSLFCGQKALALDKEESLISCEVHYHQGIDRFMKSDPQAADNELAAAVTAHASDNLRKKVQHTRVITGLDDTYSRWKIIETDNIVFHFQNKKSIDDVDGLMSGYEQEYTNASKMLRMPLPKKIDVFIWESENGVKNAMQYDKEVNYYNSDFCVLHTSQYNNRSSEILRMIGYWQKIND